MMDPRKQEEGLRTDLGGVIKDLRHLRKSSIRRLSSLKAPNLLDLFAEEARFLRDGGVKPSQIIPLFMGKLGLVETSPLARAGYEISCMVEKSADQPNYHDKHHVVEVVLAAYMLGLREDLPSYRIEELLIAAAAHDLGHTGQANQFDYEREIHSFALANPVLEKAGLPYESILRIEKMILSTDFKVGVGPVRKAYLETRSLPLMDEKRLLATQCLLLTEADVLFSCFDLDYNDFLSKLLSAEWKREDNNLSLKERHGFISSVQFVSDAAKQLGLEERRQALLLEIAKSITFPEKK